MQWSRRWHCLNIQHYLTVFRIQNAVAPGHNLLWLVILASLSAPLHGVLNAIVFGMDKETMQKLTPSQIKVSHSDCHLWHEICLTITVWGPLKLWSLIACHVWSLAQVLPLWPKSCHCCTSPATMVSYHGELPSPATMVSYHCGTSPAIVVPLWPKSCHCCISPATMVRYHCGTSPAIAREECGHSLCRHTGL